MSLEQLKREWSNEMDRAIGASELQDLTDGVQRRYSDLERTIHRRDLREIMAAFLVVGLFAAMWPLYRSSGVALSGLALICAGAFLIAYVLLSARRSEPLCLGASVREYARNRLAWVDGQIRILRTVAWWYVAPLSVGCLLLTWGMSGGSWPVFAVQAVIVVAVATVIVVLNRWAARTSLLPVHDELRRLIDALERVDDAHQDRQNTDSRGGV